MRTILHGSEMQSCETFLFHLFKSKSGVSQEDTVKTSLGIYGIKKMIMIQWTSRLQFFILQLLYCMCSVGRDEEALLNL